MADSKRCTNSRCLASSRLGFVLVLAAALLVLALATSLVLAAALLVLALATGLVLPLALAGVAFAFVVLPALALALALALVTLRLVVDFTADLLALRFVVAMQRWWTHQRRCATVWGAVRRRARM